MSAANRDNTGNRNDDGSSANADLPSTSTPATTADLNSPTSDLPPRASDLSLPRIEGFEVRDRLGADGQGEVFRALHLQLDREVALKVPHHGRGRAYEVFLNEARALAKVRHPNVVGIHDFGRSGDHVYFTMDLIEGLDVAHLVKQLRGADAREANRAMLLREIGVNPHALSDELDRALRGPRPYFKVVALWMAQAAEGLAAAHVRGVLHRDIKPSNLLLGSDGRMIVADFGLARSLKELPSPNASGVTGTYPYIAPERAAGDWASVDHRADIWALGATMFELLTFQRAYPRPGKEVLLDINTKDPESPRSFCKAIPAELERICLKAMHRDPDERYDNWRDFAADLRAWLGADDAPKRTLALVAGSVVAIAAIALVAYYFHWNPGGPTLEGLHVEPEQIVLVGAGETVQVSVEGLGPHRTAVPLEPTEIEFEYDGPEDVATVSPSGVVTALSPGNGRLRISSHEHLVIIPLEVSEPEPAPGSQNLVVRDRYEFSSNNAETALVEATAAVVDEVLLEMIPQPRSAEEMRVLEAARAEARRRASELAEVEVLNGPTERSSTIVDIAIRATVDKTKVLDLWKEMYQIQRNPPEPIVFVAFNQDLNINDEYAPTAGGDAEDRLRSRLREEGIEMRSAVSIPPFWEPEPAITAAERAGANILVFGQLKARPKGKRDDLQYGSNTVYTWEISIEAHAIRLADQRVVTVPTQSTEARVAANVTRKIVGNRRYNPDRIAETASIEWQDKEGPGEFGGDSNTVGILANKSASAVLEAIRTVLEN